MDTEDIVANDDMIDQSGAQTIIGALQASSRHSTLSPWRLALPILSVATTIGIAVLGVITFVGTFPPGSALRGLTLVVVFANFLVPVLWAARALEAQMEALKLARGMRTLEGAWEVATYRCRSVGAYDLGAAPDCDVLAAMARRSEDRDHAFEELQRRLEDIDRREEAHTKNLIQRKEQGR